MVTPQEFNKYELEKCLSMKSEEVNIKKEDDECDGNGSNGLPVINSSMILSGDIDIKPFVVKLYNPKTNHMITESGPHQDAQSAQNQPRSMMEYHEFEGCLGIKSEGLYIKEEADKCDGKGNTSLSLIDPSVSYSDDAVIKPLVDTSYNPETNQMNIESSSYQNTSETEMEHPEGRTLTEDVKTYQCNLCPYKAKLKRNLTQHTLVHQDISEVRIVYQCKLCPYKTKWKGYLSKHVLLRHQDASDASTHHCKLCPYKAKLKKYLTQHMLTHQDTSEVTIYQCKLCPYRTKWKGYLSTHVLIHRDASEVPTYQCESCPYKSKRKGDLSKHALSHKDASEVPTYRCEICPYKTKRKRDLSKHLPIHQDISRVAPLKTNQCKFCSYKTNRKIDLSRHVLIHRDASEVPAYQCEICLFKTKWKGYLSQHMMVHRDDSEVTMYQCEVCPYKTKWKGDISRHLLIHKGGAKESSQNQQQNMMENRDLKTYLGSELEEFEINEEVADDDIDDEQQNTENEGEHIQ